MLKSVVGLVACVALYLSAIYAFVWAGRRRIEWASSRGVTLGPEPKVPSPSDVWTRHSVDMTIVYGIVFLALALVGIPLGQRFGFAALAAVVFGSFWVSNSPAPVVLEMASPARRAGSLVGYWALSVADWLGYMGVVCFGTSLVVELF